MKPSTFIHTFSNGIVGTFTFCRNRHFNPHTLQIRPWKDFSRLPTDDEAPAMFPEYLEWVHLVNAEIAAQIDSDVIYLLLDSYATPPLQELWLYQKSGGRKLIGKA